MINLKKILRSFLLWVPVPSGFLYCFFFNILSFFLNSENRIYYKNNHYYFKKKKWKFSQKKAGVYFYIYGFKKRIKFLKRSYFLDEIIFNNGDVVIDCGANNGDLFLCFNKKINYYGVEASPFVFSNLKFNLLNKNIINKGLWKKRKKKLNFF